MRNMFRKAVLVMLMTLALVVGLDFVATNHRTFDDLTGEWEREIPEVDMAGIGIR